MLGWQLCRLGLDHRPPGMRNDEVYDYNTVMTILANLDDRQLWRLRVVEEGDLGTAPRLVRWTAKQALDFAARYNRSPCPQ
jgi:hypothetical protein